MKYSTIYSTIKIFIFIVLTTFLYSCETQKEEVRTQLSLDIQEVKEALFYKTRLFVTLDIVNKTNKSIFFFQPTVFIKLNGKNESSIYGLIGELDKREKEKIKDLEDYIDPLTESLIRNKKEWSKDTLFIIGVRSMLFLKPNQKKRLVFMANGIVDQKGKGDCLIYTKCHTFGNNAKLKTIPNNFKGYTLWKGDIVSDSLIVRILPDLK